MLISFIVQIPRARRGTRGIHPDYDDHSYLCDTDIGFKVKFER
jgi:hypothetical protein